MLSFTLNNKVFVLAEDSSIRITWQNPACNISEFPGDIGLGIEIPYNDTNRALLGNPERFERDMEGEDLEFEGFEARYSGVLLLAGTLIIQTATTSEGYKGWLRSSIGTLGKLHREKYIYDIDAFDEEITWENKADYDPLEDDYACPKIFNPEFFYDKGRKIELERDVLNPDYLDITDMERLFGGFHLWDDSMKKLFEVIRNGNPQYIKDKYETEALTEAFRVSSNLFVNNLNEDNTVSVLSGETGVVNLYKYLPVSVVTPMLFLRYVIKELFKDAGFSIDSNFITDNSDLRKLILYNNTDITNMVFTAIDGDPSFLEYWNDGDTTKGYFTYVKLVSRDYTKPFKYKDLLPKIQFKDFILAIQNLINVIFLPKSDNRIDILDRDSLLTGTAIDLSTYMVGDWEMGEKSDLTLKFSFSHDSDDTFFAERWDSISDRRDDEGEPVDDWTDLDDIVSPELGEIRYLRNLNLYAQYSYSETIKIDYFEGMEIQTDALGWNHLAIGFQDGYYNYGKEYEEEIGTKFSTLVGDQTTITYQRGNVSSMQYAYESFTPRLLFYNGNNTASFETKNTAVLADNYSLDWEKEDTGLLAMRWKNWKVFWATRQPVTGQADLPLNMLDYVIRNIVYKFRSREGEFIIESLECEFGANRIGICTINGYKV